MQMFERGTASETTQVWQFDEHVSAAGWIGEKSLLIASETALFTFNLQTEERKKLVSLEADNNITRSNDGRVDAWGGFWIGTMGKQAEKNAGAIYRYHEGRLVQLFDNITISNSICFSPDGQTAYFTDTPSQAISKINLDDDGWPIGKPEVFVDVAPYNPDGSVVDTGGNLWNAQWGASRVACYNKYGVQIDERRFETPQISCPAFGGANLQTLFATSAAIGLPAIDKQNAGKTFAVKTNSLGQSEHQVKIG